MLRYIGQRLLYGVPVLVGITLFSFVLIHLVPGNPIEIMLGGRTSPAIVEATSRELGLDRPLPEQYFRFIGQAARGELGESILLRRPVSHVIGERAERSLFLIGYAVVLAIALTLPLAIISARWRNRWPDHAIRLLTLVAFAMPPFWLALILVRNLSLDLDLFPVSGYGEGFWGHLHSLTLPALTVSLVLAALLTRSLRASLIDVFAEEYIEAARARGIPERRVIFKHSLRNAVIATLTVLAVNVGFLIGGTVIVERVFDIPGLGQLLVNSIFTRDFPVIQGLTLSFGLIVLAVNLACDCAYAIIDPRIRLS